MSSDGSPPPPLTSFFSSTEAVPPPIPHHRSASLSPSILIIILILAVTFVASVSLCVLLRHLNRRCLRHLTPSTSAPPSSSSAAAGDSLRMSSRRVSPENPNTALIESLPLFTFSSVTTRRSSSSADCAVCLSKFEADDQLRLLPLCCHAFHALCVDTWLHSNQTCPLCRSPIFVSEAEILKTLLAPDGENHGGGGDSFRVEIGNVSRRRTTSDSGDFTRRSYSIGSFEYLVDEDSEIVLGNTHRRSNSDFKEDQSRPLPPPASQLPAPEPSLAAEVSSGRSWLKEYVDRLSLSFSSRALSFRSSGRFFSGSSRRSEVPGVGEWDLEACRVGEEISELFRWASGV
ncbi:43kDa postsynaptic protein [Trema orientale]|uniref:RING-type E3 ubiquitin transferase n=1 Tax=Trema orientale TaxID=63057 RepID=A0A2P5FPT5_TREOI|nr:43kDa postsynaptic protein [Trema orientale]